MTQAGRNMLLRVEMWLARWWAEAKADGRKGSYAPSFEESIWCAALRTVHDLLRPSGLRRAV
jgi:hypothetical protein